MKLVGQKGENGLVFRKPWKSRVASALFALLFAGGYPAVLALPGPKIPMNPVGWLCFRFLEVAGLGFAAFLLYMSGPQCLSFDLNQRTYRYVFGWPIITQVREGPWEDIAGIYMWNRNSGRLSGYSVGIAWQDNRVFRWQATLLGTFNGLGRLDRANRLAEEISTLIGVPLVEPPFPTWSSGTTS